MRERAETKSIEAAWLKECERRSNNWDPKKAIGMKELKFRLKQARKKARTEPPAR